MESVYLFFLPWVGKFSWFVCCQFDEKLVCVLLQGHLWMLGKIRPIALYDKQYFYL